MRDLLVQRAGVEYPLNFGFADQALEIVAGKRPAQSKIVRATVVTGMPRTTVTSSRPQRL